MPRQDKPTAGRPHKGPGWLRRFAILLGIVLLLFVLWAIWEVGTHPIQPR